MTFTQVHTVCCFNPLPSCEGRHSGSGIAPYHSLLQSTSLLRGKTCRLHKILNGRSASIHFPLAREDETTMPFFSSLEASIHFPLAREDRKFHQKTPVFILCSCIFPPYNFLLFLQQIRISVSFVYYFFILTVRIPFRFHVHLWFAPPTSSLYILFHQNSSGSVTSNPGFAPICSTLFLYLSPR